MATTRRAGAPATDTARTGRLAPRDGRAERGLVLAAGLAAAVPVIASTVRSVEAGWVPVGDLGLATGRAYDVFTSWTPLVGQWSSGASAAVGEIAYSPGPLLFWLLAVPARLPGSAAFPVTMGLVFTTAVMVTVVLAHRRGGLALALLTALAIALMCGSLNTQVLSDPWNSSAGVMLVPLLFYLCWSLARGEYPLLPVTVLVASFMAQCHLVLVLPVAALVAVGLTGLALTVRRHSAAGRAAARGWALAALAVAAVCWAPPALDQGLAWAGSDRGIGNAELLWRAARARERPVGIEGGARAVAQAVGLSPWWLRSPQAPDQRVFSIFAPVGGLRLLSTLLFVGALVAVVPLSRMRRRPDVAWLAALALALCAGLAASTASFPNTPGSILSYSYSSWWAMPAGMCVWLALIWAAATLGRPRPGRRTAVPTGVAAVTVVAVLVVAVVVVTGQDDHPERTEFAPTQRTMDGLDSALPDPGIVRVDASALQLKSAVIQSLRRHGATVQTRVKEFGPDYMHADRPVDAIVDIRVGSTPAPGARRIVTERVSPGHPPVTVSLRKVR